jgi:hypothetical protein
MKIFFTSLFILLYSALAFSQEAEFSLLERKTIKFPDTKAGETLEHTFNFKNTGKQPLVIEGYEVECDCTKLIFPEKAILPGESGELKLTFDTSGKYYFQDRSVLINMNTKKQTEKIRLKVYVIPQGKTK